MNGLVGGNWRYDLLSRKMPFYILVHNIHLFTKDIQKQEFLFSPTQKFWDLKEKHRMQIPITASNSMPETLKCNQESFIFQNNNF